MGRPRDINGYFGNWLNETIKNYDTTYREICNKLGISRVTLQRYAKKQVYPQRIYLYGLAYLFNINVEYLFDLVRKDWPLKENIHKKGYIDRNREYNYR